MNQKMKKMNKLFRLYEYESLDLDDYGDDGIYTGQNPDEEKEDIRQRAEKTNLATARRLSCYDDVAVAKDVQQIFPEINFINNVMDVDHPDTINGCFISDDMSVIFHKDFTTPEDVRKLLDFCEKRKVSKIIGDVILENIEGIEELPLGFPKEIDGYFKVLRLYDLKNLNNFPTVIKSKKMPVIRPGGNVTMKKIEKYFDTLQYYNVENQKTNVFNVFDLKNKKSTNESMNIDINEVIIRASLGNLFLCEALSFDLMGKPKTLQKNASDSDRDDYEQKMAVYNKNKTIFKDYINPFIGADWGNIPEDKVKCYNDYSKIHDDLAKNNGTIKNKFEGVKFFVDVNKNIRLMYAQKKAEDKCEILFLVDEDGNVLTYKSPELKIELKKRLSIYDKIQWAFDSLKLPFANLSRQKSLRSQFLHILWYAITEKLGMNVKQKNDEISFLEYLDKNYSVLPGEKLMNDVIDDIFGYDITKTIRKRGSTISCQISNFSASSDESINIPFGGTLSNLSKNAGDFVKNVEEYLEKEGKSFNPAKYLSDRLIRAFLYAMYIRLKDEMPVYSLEKLNGYSRTKLIDCCEDLLDVDVYKTSLKFQQLQGNSTRIERGEGIKDTVYPFELLFMFPDYMYTEYVIQMKIYDSIYDRITRQVMRLNRQSGRDKLRDKERAKKYPGLSHFQRCQKEFQDFDWDGFYEIISDVCGDTAVVEEFKRQEEKINDSVNKMIVLIEDKGDKIIYDDVYKIYDSVLDIIQEIYNMYYEGRCTLNEIGIQLNNFKEQSTAAENLVKQYLDIPDGYNAPRVYYNSNSKNPKYDPDWTHNYPPRRIKSKKNDKDFKTIYDYINGASDVISKIEKIKLPERYKRRLETLQKNIREDLNTIAEYARIIMDDYSLLTDDVYEKFNSIYNDLMSISDNNGDIIEIMRRLDENILSLVNKADSYLDDSDSYSTTF